MTNGNGHLHTHEVLLQRGPGRTSLLAFKIPVSRLTELQDKGFEKPQKY